MDILTRHPVAIAVALAAATVTSWIGFPWWLPLIVGAVGFSLGLALEDR